VGPCLYVAGWWAREAPAATRRAGTLADKVESVPLGSAGPPGAPRRLSARRTRIRRGRAGALGGPKPDLRPLASGCVSALDAGGERAGRV
jgi:hypothetical protein